MNDCKRTLFDWICLALGALVIAAFVTFMFMSFENVAVNNNQSTRAFDRTENSFVKVDNALIKLLNQETESYHG